MCLMLSAPLLISRTAEPNEFKDLKKSIASLLDTKNVGINYVRFYLDSIVIIVYVDAGFAANPNFSSQLGFLVTEMEKHGKLNIVHYGSIKFKRITRSILSTALFAMVHGFDIS